MFVLFNIFDIYVVRHKWQGNKMLIAEIWLLNEDTEFEGKCSTTHSILP